MDSASTLTMSYALEIRKRDKAKTLRQPSAAPAAYGPQIRPFQGLVRDFRTSLDSLGSWFNFTE